MIKLLCLCFSLLSVYSIYIQRDWEDAAALSFFSEWFENAQLALADATSWPTLRRLHQEPKSLTPPDKTAELSLAPSWAPRNSKTHLASNSLMEMIIYYYVFSIFENFLLVCLF